ncbi:MAG: hypothetical protein MZV70_08635 [Desulfobacterales bacterium]|nr:hypothetical protein [Desulfobacterales bacterium]
MCRKRRSRDRIGGRGSNGRIGMPAVAPEAASSAVSFHALLPFPRQMPYPPLHRTQRRETPHLEKPRGRPWGSRRTRSGQRLAFWSIILAPSRADGKK